MGLTDLQDSYWLLSREMSYRCRTRYAARRTRRSLRLLARLDGFTLPEVA